MAQPDLTGGTGSVTCSEGWHGFRRAIWPCGRLAIPEEPRHTSAPCSGPQLPAGEPCAAAARGGARGSSTVLQRHSGVSRCRRASLGAPSGGRGCKTAVRTVATAAPTAPWRSRTVRLHVRSPRSSACRGGVGMVSARVIPSFSTTLREPWFTDMVAAQTKRTPSSVNALPSKAREPSVAYPLPQAACRSR